MTHEHDHRSRRGTYVHLPLPGPYPIIPFPLRGAQPNPIRSVARRCHITIHKPRLFHASIISTAAMRTRAVHPSDVRPLGGMSKSPIGLPTRAVAARRPRGAQRTASRPPPHPRAARAATGYAKASTATLLRRAATRRLGRGESPPCRSVAACSTRAHHAPRRGW